MVRNKLLGFKKVFTYLTTLILIITGIGGLGTSVDNPEVKNVILFIGDGMGENHLEWTKEEFGVDLAMDTMPIQGYSETLNFYGKITDSAAGGTALACGIRTQNGQLGTYTSDPYGAFSYAMNLSELAIEKGMRAGVVTSDSTSGATPASFSSHTNARGNEKDITKQQLASDINLIWGAGTKSATEKNIAKSNNFTLVKNMSDVNSLSKNEKSFGQFGGNVWSTVNNDGPTLSQLTEKAISLLDSEEGFFLMVEGAHIDKHSHGKNKDDMMTSLLEFDKAVKAGLDFAKENEDTLIVVTADHETGAIKLTDGRFDFTSKSHSDFDVPLRVYGTDSFVAQGKVIKNRMVPVLIADKLGCTKEEFPRQIENEWLIFSFLPQGITSNK